MSEGVRIEDIEGMRRREGIEDEELHESVRRLAVGDLVRLTFLAGSKSAECLPVRIVSISGPVFQGELTVGPTCSGLASLAAGSPVAFTTDHIHSVQQMRPAATDVAAVAPAHARRPRR